MSTREPRQRALTISTCCCRPSASSPAGVRVDLDPERRCPLPRGGARAASTFSLKPRVSPRRRFSRTVSAARASSAGRPCRRPTRAPRAANRSAPPAHPLGISPASGRTIPDRMLISVDFPAPFSPSRAVHLAEADGQRMSSFARTPGNCLVMRLARRAGARQGPARSRGRTEVPVGVAALRLSDSVRSLSSRRGGRPKRPPRILVRVPRTQLLLFDQGLDLWGLRRQRTLSLPSWICVCAARISSRPSRR